MSEQETTTTLPTNLVDLIDKLVPPEEPAPISMVPQTAGWAVLAALLLAAAVYGIVRYRMQARRNAYRQEALAALAGEDADAAEVAAILRRTALAAYPRREVAALSGPDWLAFLDRTAGTRDFTEGPGQALAEAPYTRDPHADPALLRVARHWVKRHREADA